MPYEFKNITLHILPNAKLTREEFYRIAPPNSLALDGIVSGGPFFDEYARIGNLDHHEIVVRAATMSTSMQSYYLIKGDVFDLFQENGKPHVHLWINDPDQDTSTSIYLFENYHLIEKKNDNARLTNVLETTNKLDITAGAFPLHISAKAERERAWVFEPYTSIRKSGELADASAEMMESCIKQICHRIDRYIADDSGEIELDTRHKILYDSPFGYSFIHEIGGIDARYYLFQEGKIKAYLSLISPQKDGKRILALGRKSNSVLFPVPELCVLLNELEKDIYTKKGITPPTKIWNGSDLVSGCRIHGSYLSDEILTLAIDDHLRRRNQKIFIPQ